MGTRVNQARSPAKDWRPSPKLAPGERRSARDRVLAAAGELFYREGVRAVGVDRIIEHAEVAKATFYRHFPSKDDLIGSWLALPHVRFLEWIGPEAERRASTPEEAIVQYFTILAEWFENENYCGCPFISSAAEFSAPDHPTSRALADHQTAIVHWFEQKLRAAGKRNPHRLAEELILVAAGAMVVADTSSGAGDRAIASAKTLLEAAPSKK